MAFLLHLDESLIFDLDASALVVEVLGVSVGRVGRLFELVAYCLIVVIEFGDLLSVIIHFQLAVSNGLRQLAVFCPQSVALLNAEVISLFQLAQLTLKELDLCHL